MKFFMRAMTCAMLAAVMCVSLLSGCAKKTSDDEAAGEGVSEKIIINEVMTSNDIAFPASNGVCYDWVELRNLTDQEYDLSNCYLTDDVHIPKRFQLTGLVVEPYGYATVYLSGLNGVDVDGYLHAGFKLSSMGETVFLLDASGIVISSVKVPESQKNVSYGFPPSAEEYTEESCVWFALPTPGEKNAEDYAKDPSQLERPSNGVIINEYLSNNTFSLYDSDGEYSDWIELYNPTDKDASMRGYALTDSADLSDGKWYFPDDVVIPSGECLLVFCSGKAAASKPEELHCSFKIGDDDGVLTLVSPYGEEEDSIPVYTLPDNTSCGIDSDSGEVRLFASPTPGKANNTYSYDIESSSVHGITDSAVIISEVASVSSTRDAAVRDFDFVELYNNSAAAVNLKGYGLTDSEDEIKFCFPDVTIEPGQYLVVNCAAFGINRSGETIYLTYPDKHIADIFSAGKQDVSLSRGRLLNDMAKWYYFTEPTPGEENPAGNSYQTYAGQPVFSADGGFVEKGFTLTISHSPEVEVRYTVDGSEPNRSSQIYKDGIGINETTVVRAAAFKDGALPSEITTATFFVDAAHALPIVSVSSDPYGLFSDEKGIFSSGTGLTGLYANYRSDVERLASFEYYVDGKRAVEFDAGIRVFGRGTRGAKQKSMAVMLREIYGSNTVNFPFFSDNENTEVSSLVLRQSGQEWQASKIRDELCAAIIKNRVKCDYMDMTPVALYINGQYWGLYYIREKQNEDYIAARYGYESGEIDIIRDQTLPVSGTMDAYKEMVSFITRNDIKKEEVYEQFCEMVDMESLMDFWICQAFFGNNDTANIRCHYCPGDENSKWRWMIFDLDCALYPYTLKYNHFERHMLDPKGHGFNDGSSTVITTRLAQNETFRREFVSRFCYHLKNTFNQERTIPILKELVQSIEGEIELQYQRWGEPSPETWNGHIKDIEEYLCLREEYIIRHLKDSFDFSDAEFKRIYNAA